jgi:hypothetical protein
MFTTIADNIVYIALAAAIIIVTGTSLVMSQKIAGYHISSFMGNAKWDFTQSWASNLTIFSALLTTILAAPLDSNNHDLPHFNGLNLFYSLLALLAPIVYNATGSWRLVDTPASATREKDSPPTEKQYQGYILSFLVACTLTLWAVIGELGSIFPLLSDLNATTTSIFSAPVIVLFQVILFIGIALIACFYAPRTIYWTVKEQIGQEAIQTRQRALHLVRQERAQFLLEPQNKNMAPEKDLQPAKPSWSLL